MKQVTVRVISCEKKTRTPRWISRKLRRTLQGSDFDTEDEMGGTITKGGVLLRKELLGAGSLLDLLSIEKMEWLETLPGKVGATIEKTPAVDFGLGGKVLAIGSTSIPKYNIDFQEMFRSAEVSESETKTARVMEA